MMRCITEKTCSSGFEIGLRWSIMHSNFDRIFNGNYCPPTSSSTSLRPAQVAKWQGSPSHRPLGTLPCAFERDILASIPHERCPALASIQSAGGFGRSLWFQDSQFHNSNSNIGTNNKTAKPPVIQRIVFRSFSHSTAILCDLYTNFNQACIPCITPCKNVQYLCLTADHLQSCTQWVSTTDARCLAGELARFHIHSYSANIWRRHGAKSQHENSLWWKTSEGASIDIDPYQSYVHIYIYIYILVTYVHTYVNTIKYVCFLTVYSIHWSVKRLQPIQPPTATVAIKRLKCHPWESTLSGSN